jgi:competence protein ComEC
MGHPPGTDRTGSQREAAHSPAAPSSSAPSAADPTARQGPDAAQRHAPRYHPLVIVLVAAAAGVAADRWLAPAAAVFRLGAPAWWAMAAACGAAWWLLWRRGRDALACVALWLCVAAVAGSWHHCRWSLFRDDDMLRFSREIGRPACVEAIAIESPKSSPPGEYDPLRAIPAGEYCWLDVAVVAARDGAEWRPAGGRARLVVYSGAPSVRPGDRLRVFAQLEAIPPPRNPGEFDLARHRRTSRVCSLLRANFPECVGVIESGSRFGLRRALDGVRARGREVLAEHLSPERAGLAAAVLLGQRDGIDDELAETFLKTGTIHLLAISGLHVGILAGAMMFLLLRVPLPLPRAWTMTALGVALVAYAILVDARPPVVRATVLMLVACATVGVGRRGLSFNSLAAAGLVVLAMNPAELFQPGAQLSFLAVAALMRLGPRSAALQVEPDPLRRLILRTRPWPVRAGRAVWAAARDVTLAGAAIWLLTVPLVTARFHVLSLSALVLNTLLWIPMAVALWSGFATLVFGAVCAPLGRWFGAVCDASLGLIEGCAGWAAGVPGSFFWVPGPPEWWLAGFYAALGLWLAAPRLRPPPRWRVAFLGAWTAVGFLPAAARHGSDDFECRFLAMGHGCAVVLHLPGGQTMLYDAGRMAAPRQAERAIAAALWSRGVTHLDAVVISHPDVDHYNALPGLLEKFSVGAVYVSPVMFENETPALGALRRAIEDRGVPVRTIRAGDRLDAGADCRIEVLHPPGRGVLGGDNANSLVLAVESRGLRVLLTGDIEPPGLLDLLAEEPYDCDVLLAPHHGSRASNPPGLAAWCSPEWVVVSGPLRWDPEPVESAYGASGARVLHTEREGAVTVRRRPGAVTVEGFLAR